VYEINLKLNLFLLVFSVTIAIGTYLHLNENIGKDMDNLRHSATSRKVATSRPTEVIAIFQFT
jgi:hypothetical protein